MTEEQRAEQAALEADLCERFPRVFSRDLETCRRNCDRSWARSATIWRLPCGTYVWTDEDFRWRAEHGWVDLGDAVLTFHVVDEDGDEWERTFDCEEIADRSTTDAVVGDNFGAWSDQECEYDEYDEDDEWEEDEVELEEGEEWVDEYDEEDELANATRGLVIAEPLDSPYARQLIRDGLVEFG